MDRILTKKEAVRFLGLDEKTFDNYFRNADEFACLPRPNNRGRLLFDEEELKRWLAGYVSSHLNGDL